MIKDKLAPYKDVTPNIKRVVTGFDPTGQTPLLEHHSFGETRPKWIIWLAYNPDHTAGTYLVLNEDGSIWRETTYPDGSVENAVIKPASFRRGFGHAKAS